jgi:hypothetical protein
VLGGATHCCLRLLSPDTNQSNSRDHDYVSLIRDVLMTTAASLGGWAVAAAQLCLHVDRCLRTCWLAVNLNIEEDLQSVTMHLQ